METNQYNPPTATQYAANFDASFAKARRFIVKHRTKLLAVAVVVLVAKNHDLKKDNRSLKMQNVETKRRVDSANKDLAKAESIFDQYFGPRYPASYYSNN